MSECENLDFRDPIEREIILENRRAEQQEMLEEKKKRNKTYLKGRYGKRLYYDYDKKFKVDFNDYSDDYNNIDEDDKDYDEFQDPRRQLKCIFKKDLRREKLFAYFKYLNGKKVLVRDLAWKFAVTERTIQADIKYLIENNLIERQINYTIKGKQTKNSYIVNLAKAKDLPCVDTQLNVVFLAKQDSEYYILTETKYKGRDKSYKSPTHKTIEEYKFNLPFVKVSNINKLDKRSISITNKIFNQDLSQYYKGYIFKDISQGYHIHPNRTGKYDKTFYKTKYYFTLYLLNECLNLPDGYRWIKLSIAPRRLKSKSANKCLVYIKNNLLG